MGMMESPRCSRNVGVWSQIWAPAGLTWAAVSPEKGDLETQRDLQREFSTFHTNYSKQQLAAI